MSTFTERTKREIERRERKSTPKEHLSGAALFFFLSLGFMVVASLLLFKTGITPLSLLETDNALTIVVAAMAFSYMKSFVDELSEYFYSRRVRKYERLRRAAELSEKNSDILTTNVLIPCGKLEQK